MKTTLTTILGGRPGDAVTVCHLRADGNAASAELTFDVRDVAGVTTYSEPSQFGLGQR